jgi:hypothetical protein
MGRGISCLLPDLHLEQPRTTEEACPLKRRGDVETRIRSASPGGSLSFMTRKPPSMADYLAVEDERPFLSKAFHSRVFGGNFDDEDRLRYAKLIEERDPPRAEWLRLEVALHARAADDPAVIARFIELARMIGFDFAAELLRERILNCGSEKARDGGPRVRFSFACSKRWETLAPAESETESVRFCQQCKEHVYRCDTVEQAASRALAGQCIAIPHQLTDGGVENMEMGRPDPLGDWSRRLFPGF